MYEKNNIYYFSILKKYPQIVHGISTRILGSIKNSTAIQEDSLHLFLQQLQIPRQNVVLAEQMHTHNIQFIRGAETTLFQNTDGFITKGKNIFLGIHVADCLPIILYDPVKNIVGTIHAGYKGIYRGIIENIIKKFEELGSHTEDIIVGTGPGIGICCYDVPEERIKQFQQKYPLLQRFFELRDTKFYLDLPTIAKQLLMARGLRETHIELSNLCTKSNIDKFYSYRGDTKETSGQILSIIGMKG